jgi:lactoylglutathione lyase
MRFYHLGIKTKDLAASRRFYCEWLGLREIETVEILGKKFYFIGNDSFQIELEEGNPGDTQAEPSRMTGLNHMSLVVDDIHALVKNLKEKGAAVLDPFHPRPDRWTTFLNDPDGVLIQIIQYI